jgi:two-component sensor histidine kinase
MPLRRQTHQLTSRIEQLEGELVLRQLLLEEVIHRTKNRLQLVIAALWEQVNSRSGTRVRRIVLGIQKQVLTLERAHHQFYGPGESNAHICVAEICESIRDTFGERARQVALAFNVAEVPLLRHQQICLSLILYELLTNAFKHAFPYGTQGVDHDRSERRRVSDCYLVISDDGIGKSLPANASTGMALVESFASLLRGRLLVTSDNGTIAKVAFPLSRDPAVQIP